MTSSSSINFSSIRARLKKAEESLEAGSKSKIFNEKYMESYEPEILTEAQSLGVSSYDIQVILNTATEYVSETLKDASETTKYVSAMTRIVEAITKAQQQYTQSVSDLQLDYVAAAKNAIQNIASAQKVLATSQYTDEFVKQSNKITENIASAVHINNQLTVNAINAAAENFRTLNRTIESVTEFNTIAAKAWNSFFTAQQQQFRKS
jgi:antitoxin component HigA of HigAB toxin-antitoxin module